MAPPREGALSEIVYTWRNVMSCRSKLAYFRIANLRAGETTNLSASRNTPIKRTSSKRTAAMGIACLSEMSLEGFAKPAGSGKALAVNGGVLSCVLWFPSG